MSGPAVHLYNTRRGPMAQIEGRFFEVAGESWDRLLARDDLRDHLVGAARAKAPLPEDFELQAAGILKPIGSQEVWAAGVTYLRSREARVEEASGGHAGGGGGGGDFYDRVYAAARPELFFKASPHRVVGYGQPVRIRADSRWNVPEPELTLVVSPRGRIIGYTAGNDMSSRDIEGENPLYLPQAKVYDGSCALGPGILVTPEDLPPTIGIRLEIRRGGCTVFEGSSTLSRMKRSTRELVEYLFRESTFPAGVFLMTGTGVVPPSSFTLQSHDEIHVEIDGVGILVNPVA